MTQHCRYCAELVVGDEPYCSYREKVVSENYAKRPNNCKHFQFNPIDAFFENERGYQPRDPNRKKESDENQMRIEL